MDEYAKTSSMHGFDDLSLGYALQRRPPLPMRSPVPDVGAAYELRDDIPGRHAVLLPVFDAPLQLLQMFPRDPDLHLVRRRLTHALASLHFLRRHLLLRPHSATLAAATVTRSLETVPHPKKH
jgi:hypothetical protein